MKCKIIIIILYFTSLLRILMKTAFDVLFKIFLNVSSLYFVFVLTTNPYFSFNVKLLKNKTQNSVISAIHSLSQTSIKYSRSAGGAICADKSGSNKTLHLFNPPRVRAVRAVTLACLHFQDETTK